jgi:hypothetical protein
MNERIKELALQAGFYYTDKTGFITPAGCDPKKFAEMIVRECIDIAGKEDFDVMMKEGYPCSQTAKNIKEHFGVKE